MIQTSSPLGNLLILAILMGIAGHSVSLWRRGRWWAFDPLNAFWAGVLTCYVHQPLSYGEVFIGWHGEALFNKTLLWIVFGLFWVVVGYELVVGCRWGYALPHPPPKLIPGRLAFVAYLFILVGIFGYSYIVSVSGGWTQWLSVGRGDTNYERVSGYVGILTSMLPVGVVLLLFHAELHRVGAVKRMAIWALAGMALLWFIYLGTRSRTITFTGAMLMAWYLPRRTQPPLPILCALFVGLLVLTTFQGEYRDRFTNLCVNVDATEWQEVRQVSLPKWLGGQGKEARGHEISRGAEFNCVMTTVKLVPEEVPYSYGYGFLECFTRWIPRDFWPEKRYPHLESKQALFRLGELTDFVPLRGRPDLVAGPAFTFAGVWYHVGGMLGLIVGGLYTGVLLRVIRTFLERSPRSEGAILIYPHLLMVGFFEAAFEPMEWTIRLPTNVLPLVVILYLCRQHAGPLRMCGRRLRRRLVGPRRHLASEHTGIRS